MIWGESGLFLGIWGAKAKYFYGAEEIIFRDLGRSMHYFQGSMEHRPPPGGPQQVFCAQKNCLVDMVLLSTHNKCFGSDIRKLVYNSVLLSGSLSYK